MRKEGVLSAEVLKIEWKNAKFFNSKKNLVVRPTSKTFPEKQIMSMYQKPAAVRWQFTGDALLLDNINKFLL